MDDLHGARTKIHSINNTQLLRMYNIASRGRFHRSQGWLWNPQISIWGILSASPGVIKHPPAELFYLGLYGFCFQTISEFSHTHNQPKPISTRTSHQKHLCISYYHGQQIWKVYKLCSIAYVTEILSELTLLLSEWRTILTPAQFRVLREKGMTFYC